MDDLEKILKVLAEGGIDFVVIGGFAAVTHGSQYLTQDVDVCMVLTPQSVEKIRKALAPLDPVHRMTAQKLPFATFPKSTEGLRNLYLRTRYGVLDILTEVEGVGGLDAIRDRANTSLADGVAYKVISLPDLITCKETVGRDKDLLVAKELRAIAALRGIAVPPPPPPKTAPDAP
jgi:predicted nucleotidyltransferase